MKLGHHLKIRTAGILLLSASCLPVTATAAEMDKVYEDLQIALKSGRVRHPGFDQAWKVLKPLAEKEEDLKAIFYISYLFRLGVGGAERNPRLARLLIEEAAEKGLAKAQQQLGYNYERGVYGTIDNKLAVSWYKRASDAGSCVAIDRLTKAWQYGELDLAKDPDQSAKWAKKKPGCQ